MRYPDLLERSVVTSKIEAGVLDMNLTGGGLIKFYLITAHGEDKIHHRSESDILVLREILITSTPISSMTSL